MSHQSPHLWNAFSSVFLNPEDVINLQYKLGNFKFNKPISENHLGFDLIFFLYLLSYIFLKDRILTITSIYFPIFLRSK